MQIIETDLGREITIPGWLRDKTSLFVDFDGEGAPGYESVTVRVIYYHTKADERRGEIDIYVNEILFKHLGAWVVNSNIIQGMMEKYKIDRNGIKIEAEDL